MSISRRRFMNAAPIALMPVVWPSAQTPETPPASPVPPGFPAHPPEGRWAGVWVMKSQ